MNRAGVERNQNENRFNANPDDETQNRSMGVKFGNILGCASLIATIGSALVCKVRLCFSSADSVRRILLLPELLDLSDLPPKLKPRLCLGGAGCWGDAIFNTPRRP